MKRKNEEKRYRKKKKEILDLKMLLLMTRSYLASADAAHAQI